MSLRETTVERAPLVLLLILASAITGCIDSPGDGVNVITVGATDCQDHVAEFSGSGPTRDGRTKPTVVAPGVDVVSTVPPGLEHPDYIDVYYAKESGTSLSTPVAAGVAALLLQAEPETTPAGIKAAITRGARKIDNTLGEEYEGYYQGAGLIDANRSYGLLDEDICGVMPDRWTAGRWAFPGGGKAISPGIDAGADRDQKKIYALAPSDEDWTTKFVFFTNRERRGINTTAKGDVADWLTLQDLPDSVPANDQKVFGATVNVPDDAAPGLYQGSIDVTENGTAIVSIPVFVEVARHMEVIKGVGAKADVLERGQWHYYYLDVPLGTDALRGDLRWKGDGELDLFMLAPTSEYYPGEDGGKREKVEISGPPSGRWLIAVHGRNLTDGEKYTLEVEVSLFESVPRSWNVGAVVPGQTRSASFDLVNLGPSWEDIDYRGVVEKATATGTTGSVGDNGTWRYLLEVPEGVSKVSARLTWQDDGSDLDLYLYDPGGVLARTSEGTDSVEEMEEGGVEEDGVVPGSWQVEVFGYDVPGIGEQEFELEITHYTEETWPWVAASGPERLDDGSKDSLKAELAVPPEADDSPVKGFIEVRSANGTLAIPVAMTVAGAAISGTEEAVPYDRDGDGYFDQLSIGVEVNAPIPGEYRLEGSLTDCQGNLVKWITRTERLREDDVISLDAAGFDIWRKASCGPLGIGGLFLYNSRGDLIDSLSKRQTIDRDPGEFQPPPAYFDGGFEMNVSMGKVKRLTIGVGVVVIKPGHYTIKGRLEDDRGEEIGVDEKGVRLEAGDATVLLDFNPTKFMMLQRTSRLNLKDLTLHLEGEELERLDDAWSSEVVGPEYFKA